MLSNNYDKFPDLNNTNVGWINYVRGRQIDGKLNTINKALNIGEVSQNIISWSKKSFYNW